jgi:DNA-binding SARP family transcriptional activator
MAGLRLYILGTPRIEIDGDEPKLPRRKGLAMLVYLTVTREAQRRDTLATLFWPDSGQSKARGNLRRELRYRTTGWYWTATMSL